MIAHRHKMNTGYNTIHCPSFPTYSRGTLSKTTLGSWDAMATSTHYSYLQPEQLGEDVGTVIALAAFRDANMGCVDFCSRSAGSEQLLREPRRASVGGHGARASQRQEESGTQWGQLVKAPAMTQCMSGIAPYTELFNTQLHIHIYTAQGGAVFS